MFSDVHSSKLSAQSPPCSRKASPRWALASSAFSASISHVVTIGGRAARRASAASSRAASLYVGCCAAGRRCQLAGCHSVGICVMGAELYREPRQKAAGSAPGAIIGSMLPRPCAFRRGTAALFTALALLIAWVAAAQNASNEKPAGTKRAFLLTVQDAIGPATADYIVRGIESAEEEGAALVVVELDTPGGLDSSMRSIIQAILGSSVPVAVYVWPQGARAASAGTYILYAAHIAAMAPATNLGAATPVPIGGTAPAPGGESPSAPGSEPAPDAEDDPADADDDASPRAPA